ncbi:transposase family protein [Streptosporangium sp. NPDC002544]|uniref:transposase family protein n=1 Tax=Streptosporangium sp. NPDC002544 TaxID=3154538 RepID=UPI0033194E79
MECLDVVTTLAAVQTGLPSLADPGYERAADVIRVPIKKKAGRPKLDHDQHTYNKLLRGLRGVGERANGRTPCSPSHSRPYAG